MFYEEGVLKIFAIFTEKHLYSLFNKVTDLQTYSFTPTQVFYYKYCKMFMNTYFDEHVSGCFGYILRISQAGLLQNLRTPDSVLSVQVHGKHEMF